MFTNDKRFIGLKKSELQNVKGGYNGKRCAADFVKGGLSGVGAGMIGGAAGMAILGSVGLVGGAMQCFGE